MEMSNIEQVIGGASSRLRWNAGNVSSLASSRAREAGSRLCGESCKHQTMTRKTIKTKKAKNTKKMTKTKKTKTNIRVTTWNFGTPNDRDAEVVETLSRRQVHICGVQEHRFTGSQVHTLTDKDHKFKFSFYAQAGILLAKNWADKVIEVHRISDRIIILKLIISKAVFTFLSVSALWAKLIPKKITSTTSCNMRLPRSQPLRYWL